jgi:cellulose synthase/poly-beta-1,6-N-acetylglucosamine synthase-like glycosyltransferase
MLKHLPKYHPNTPRPRKLSPEAYFPSICVLIPAYNEEAVIEDKIRNLACLDYPQEKLSVIIACDGCTDNTAIKARHCALEMENSHLKIDIIEFIENQGKVFILNQMIDQIEDDLIALSDASALISIDALLLAASHFCDYRIAVVAASYKLLHPGSDGEDTYWQYQSGIKRGEAALGDPIGVHGALYLFRRPLFEPLLADTINDDFILPMGIVSSGYRAVYEPKMIALELEQATRQMDLKRRVRLGAGNFQQLLRLPKLLSPSLGWTAFNFFSGKALRAVMPLLILIQLAICILLSTNLAVFLTLSAIQLLGFFIAWLSSYLPQKLMHKYVNILFYLANGYRCSLVGIIRYMLGLERGRWTSVSAKEKTS